jgi:hypothetical protein
LLVTKKQETNQLIFDYLKKLLKDKRQKVKTNTCTALADPDAKVLKPDTRFIDSINEFTRVAGHELNGVVRRTAEDSLTIIKESVKEWVENQQK